MKHKRTLESVREESVHAPQGDVPILDRGLMSAYEQDELLSEILGSQLRRRALSRYAPKPAWSQFL